MQMLHQKLLTKPIGKKGSEKSVHYICKMYYTCYSTKNISVRKLQKDSQKKVQRLIFGI